MIKARVKHLTEEMIDFLTSSPAQEVNFKMERLLPPLALKISIKITCPNFQQQT